MEITENPKSIIETDWNIHDLTLHGCKLGDSCNSIPLREISDTTRLDIEIEELIKFSKLPLKEKTKQTFSHEGWVQTQGGFNLRLSKGKIVQFGFFMDALATLNVTSPESIIEFLGKPDTTQNHQRNGKVAETEFYYQDKQLMLVWSYDFNKLLNINIGPKYGRQAPNKARLRTA